MELVWGTLAGGGVLIAAYLTFTLADYLEKLPANRLKIEQEKTQQMQEKTKQMQIERGIVPSDSKKLPEGQ